MSENIPESVPTSADRRSQRPTKKRALTPSSAQSQHLDALFANPERSLKEAERLSNSPAPRNLAAPPEIVANVQGSSAGAGSGEFHVYKASRRREYERLRLMDEEKTKEEEDIKYEAKVDEMKKADLEKTEKNRAKREKARMRAQKKKKGKGGDGMEGAEGEREDEKGVSGSKIAKLKANVANGAGGSNGKKEDGEDGDSAAVADNADEIGIGIVIHDED